MISTESSDRLAEDARLGQEAFDRHVKDALRPEDDGKFVAIDVETGEYEIDADDYEATERILARKPGARLWLMRAGAVATYQVFREAGAGEA